MFPIPQYDCPPPEHWVDSHWINLNASSTTHGVDVLRRVEQEHKDELSSIATKWSDRLPLGCTTSKPFEAVDDEDEENDGDEDDEYGSADEVEEMESIAVPVATNNNNISADDLQQHFNNLAAQAPLATDESSQNVDDDDMDEDDTLND